MFAVQPAQPFVPIIVKVVEAPTKEISVADILMGSVGITGLFLLGAALFGFALGGALILFKRWQARANRPTRRTAESSTSRNRLARRRERARLVVTTRAIVVALSFGARLGRTRLIAAIGADGMNVSPRASADGGTVVANNFRFPEPFRHEHPPVRNVNEIVEERLTLVSREPRDLRALPTLQRTDRTTGPASAARQRS